MMMADGEYANHLKQFFKFAKTKRENNYLLFIYSVNFYPAFQPATGGGGAIIDFIHYAPHRRQMFLKFGRTVVRIRKILLSLCHHLVQSFL